MDPFRLEFKSAVARSDFTALKSAIHVPMYRNSIYIQATVEGKLDVLKWAVANGCPWDSTYVLFLAGMHKHFHIFRWVVANGSPIGDEYDFDINLSQIGRVKHGFRWLVAQGYPLTVQMTYRAVKQDDMGLFLWLLARNCPVEPDVGSEAVARKWIL